MVTFHMHFLLSKTNFEYYVTILLSINEFNLLTFTNLIPIYMSHGGGGGGGGGNFKMSRVGVLSRVHVAVGN